MLTLFRYRVTGFHEEGKALVFLRSVEIFPRKTGRDYWKLTGVFDWLILNKTA